MTSESPRSPAHSLKRLLNRLRHHDNGTSSGGSPRDSSTDESSPSGSFAGRVEKPTGDNAGTSPPSGDLSPRQSQVSAETTTTTATLEPAVSATKTNKDGYSQWTTPRGIDSGNVIKPAEVERE